MNNCLSAYQDTVEGVSKEKWSIGKLGISGEEGKVVLVNLNVCWCYSSHHNPITRILYS